MEKLRQIGKGRNNEIVSEWTHLFFFYFFGLFVFIFFFVWHNSYYQYFFFFIRNYRGIYEWMFSTHSALCHILWGKKKKKSIKLKSRSRKKHQKILFKLPSYECLLPSSILFPCKLWNQTLFCQEHRPVWSKNTWLNYVIIPFIWQGKA